MDIERIKRITKTFKLLITTYENSESNRNLMNNQSMDLIVLKTLLKYFVPKSYFYDESTRSI